VDDKELAVYRDTGKEFWTRIATVPIPPESDNTFMYTPEPFVFNGKSYFAVGIKAQERPRSLADLETWILGLDGAYQERCGNDETPVRSGDPEVFVGTHHVYLYYDVYGPFKIMRYTSRLRAD
jgi:hypothetical protein